MNNKKFSSMLLNSAFPLRVIIVMGWLSLIGGLLFIPRLVTLFFSQQPTINVIAFAQLITPEACMRFKERTGINVHITYVDSDDEILTKLKVAAPHTYDMIIAFDYMIDTMRQEGRLQLLDYAAIPNTKSLNPALCNCSFDPENRYSVPFSYLAYGIGYNKKYFKNGVPPLTWDLIFKDPALQGFDYKLCMLNEMREAIFLAAHYLFKRNDNLSEKELATIEELLIDQKKWVETYASDRLDYLLAAGIVPIALTPSSYMRRVLKEGEEFGFEVPQEGTLIAIENCALPLGSKKKESAHVFIDFLLSEEIVALNCEAYGLYPSVLGSGYILDNNLFARLGYPLGESVLHKSSLIPTSIPLSRLEDLWIAVKSV